MRISALIVLAGLLAAAAGLASAQTAGSKPTVLVTGDSYTRRSGLCSTTNFSNCENNQELPRQDSYSIYLNSSSVYHVVLSDNSARGGETCAAGGWTFSGGLHNGFAKGLVSDVAGRISNRDANVVSILIGVNDILLHNQSQASLQTCLYNLIVQAAQSGKKIVVMTYPPVRSDAQLWGAGINPNAKIAEVNNAIRYAVGLYNMDYGNANVRLAETSNAWTAAEAPAHTHYWTNVQDNINFPDNTSQSAPDGAHPNTRGARRLAKAWVEQVCGKGWINC